ncbi:hypothetical protein [Corynebacterium sp. H78]|uniref:hypothetical protein n=1 Tax=Corynebacterium sp. H78 TaxID=3133417 RepID=UPI0030A798A2
MLAEIVSSPKPTSKPTSSITAQPVSALFADRTFTAEAESSSSGTEGIALLSFLLGLLLVVAASASVVFSFSEDRYVAEMAMLGWAVLPFLAVSAFRITSQLVTIASSHGVELCPALLATADKRIRGLWQITAWGMVIAIAGVLAGPVGSFQVGEIATWGSGIMVIGLLINLFAGVFGGLYALYECAGQVEDLKIGTSASRSPEATT